MTQAFLFDRPARSPVRADTFDDHPLYWYQYDARDAALEKLRGFRSTLIVMATGLGKTRLFGVVARDWPGRVLILVHRDELADQAQATLEAITGEPVDIEKANLRASFRSRVVVGSVQTLCKAKRLERFPRDHFSLIVTDEAHHYVAPSFRKPLEYFDAAKILGVTATADRGDKKALGRIFESVAYEFDIYDGVEQGFLCPITIFRTRLDQIDLSGVLRDKGDLNISGLDTAIQKATLAMVDEAFRLEPDRQRIMFLPGIPSAELAYHRWNEIAPGSTIFVHNRTEILERKRLIRDFRAQRYPCLVNVGIAVEGFDAPAVSNIVMGRPTLSRSLYTQMTGRGTRVIHSAIANYPERHQAELRKAAIAASSKQKCVITDFSGNTGKHELVGPEDVLGGKFSDDERTLAKKLTRENPGRDVMQALAEAREHLKNAARVRVQVVSTVEEFDPFAMLRLRCRKSERFATKWRSAATPGMLEALASIGLEDKDLAGMSRKAAGDLLREFKRRRQQHLASYKQMKRLREFGIVDADKVTFSAAGRAMAYLQDTGWGRRFPVDQGRLREILDHQREPGED